MNFDSTRFTNFAKYDIAINKTFYKSLSIVTFIGMLSIAFLGFTGRYSMWKSMETIGNEIPVDNTMHYSATSQTMLYLLGFSCIMMCIFAGCWAHNMREKQGRITELTLPATNLEKFVWHVGLMLVGGWAVCTISYLFADALNAILTLSFIGTDAVMSSLTADAFNLFTFGAFDDDWISLSELTNDVQFDHNIELFVASFVFFGICSSIEQIITYLLGNSFKYKWNIILTYIILQIIGFICAIATLIGFTVTLSNLADANGETFIQADEFVHSDKFIYYATTPFFVLGALSLIISAGFIIWSYKRYTNAQITTTLNK